MKTSIDKCDRCGKLTTVNHSKDLDLKYCDECLSESHIGKIEF